MLIENTLKCSPDSTLSIIEDVKDNITISGLTMQEQLPLLLVYNFYQEAACK